MPFQRRRSCMFHWRRRAWLTIWDKVKSHGTVRLMHRKRVTCDLHDSFRRSMTIKHAIPRIPLVSHPDGQLWGDIEWAIELLYNSVKTGSQLVWWPDPSVTRCGRENQHPTEWAPGPPVEQTWRTGKKRLWPKEWWWICCSSVRSPTPCHSKTLSNPFRTLSIKWEVYFFKRTVSLVFIVTSLLLCWVYNNTF